MRFARFFVDRPIFAAVLSILITLVGAISLFRLPISEYPEVAPPSVQVRAMYPGASPQVIAETVAAPIEEAVNGVEGMLYMSSNSTMDGVMQLTVTFKVGTDIDNAQVLVQNRVAQALPRLPEVTRQFGVTTVKASANLTMVVHLVSPDGRYDPLYIRNYATLQVRDILARIPGMGQVFIFGAGDYAMRVWLDPQKAAARNITASDVVAAIREQNIDVAAGQVGAPPIENSPFQLTINSSGRLVTEEEFGEIVVKADPATGELTKLKELARIELGASEYSLRSLLNNKPAVAIAIFQTPDANALQLSDNVRAAMADLKTRFPEGLDFDVVYDPTRFVAQSIDAVIATLIEAILLVVIVVIVFLQTWRASIIPLVAVPVSIIGTFAILLAAGFSINTLSLFGLVLAIGIVVDDAIVVVENVERHIEHGMTPQQAAYKAMEEVTGPIIAIALVLCAVFVPIAFVSGLTGQFYQQFALTIAISTVISAFNSLTLSPALARVLLKPHGAPKDALQRGIDRLFGWFFRPFNRFFARSSARYERTVGGVVRHKSVALAVYVVLLIGAWFMFQLVPGGFVPTPDKQYAIGVVKLPAGASLDRTEAVVKQMGDIALKTPGVSSSVAFPGLNIAAFSNSPNTAVIFYGLEGFEERAGDPQKQLGAIVGNLNGAYAQIQDAQIFVVPPPPVDGLGALGGFKVMVEDRAGLGYRELYNQTWGLIGEMTKIPGIPFGFSNYDVNVPQLDARLDREKAKRQGVAITDVYTTMQVYLGSLYVNDFNRFGRTYRVVVQADAEHRMGAGDVGQLKTRNQAGEMVALASLVDVRDSAGPDMVQRYNGYPAADINGNLLPFLGSTQAIALIEQLSKQQLPNGMGIEWTDLTYQEILSGNTMVYVFPLCVLLVFLVLAAQYESWSLPFAVILIVPMCILSAMTGIWLAGLLAGVGLYSFVADNNIFTQVALVVLVGLACKNAILIVEFARELEHQGRSIIHAAMEACRLRLRPILMTSFAFIMGVVPLVLADGAGAEMRRAMGVAVFSGMLGVTFFGLVLTPMFYVLVRKLAGGRLKHHGGQVAPVCTESDDDLVKGASHA